MTFLKYTLQGIVLFALAVGSVLLVQSGMLTSGIVVALVFAVLLGYMLYRVHRQQRVLYDFLRNHSGGAMRELPLVNGSDGRLAQELERVLEQYRKRLYDEATMQKYYELVMDNVGIGLLSCDEVGRVHWSNHTAERMVGSLPVVPREWLQMPQGGQRTVMYERHDVPQQLLVSATRMRREGNREQVLLTLRDIRHVLERQQTESWKQLSRVLTHEIMNSLSPILSLAELLGQPSETMRRRPDYTERMTEALGTIHRRGTSLLQFVESYRQLTRLPEPHPTAIAAERFLRDLQQLYAQGDVAFAPVQRDFTFHADRHQLEQVAINLIKNAREAVAANRPNAIRVTLSQDIETHDVRLTVWDCGTGITPEAQERIFLPFFTTKPEGSGIGLALCRQIVNLHGGYMQVRSQIGQGSTFTVVLPQQGL